MASIAPRESHASFDPRHLSPRHKMLALLTVIIALVLEIVDMTIVNTALPAIKASLGTDAHASQWIIAGYSLAFAVLLLAGGRLGDSYGYRRMFVLGIAGFTLSSLACGLSATAGQLVAARMMQGATGAIMAPQAMALVQVIFEPLERVSRMALFGLIGGLAAISGPILGGLLLAANPYGLGWRSIFLINLPIGALAIIAGLMFLPRTRSDRPAGYDLVGMVLFGLALAALFWPLIGAGDSASPVITAGCLVCVIPLVWAGWRHVTARVRAQRPALFDPVLFSIPAFRTGLAISIVFAASSAGFLLVFAFAMQAERGATPLFTGIMHMPYGLGAMFGIGFVGRNLLPRLGRRVLVIGAGMMLPAVCLVLAGVTALHWPWPVIAVFLVLCGTGMGMTSGCIGPVSVSRVDRQHAGAASALLKTAQQLGAAFGIAVVGGVYFWWGGVHHLPALAAAVVIATLLTMCVTLSLRLPQRIFDTP
ncbi:MFS transporter [Novosphingobium sp.]|uniref:MFS transporter n=1 Tax=Novosphingobium sp. TaxID=1874826 RepID=UPI003B51FCC0